MTTSRIHLATAALALLLALGAEAAPHVHMPFIRTGRTVVLNQLRQAALFGDGTVLIYDFDKQMERYDPLTETFSALAAETNTHQGIAGVSLPDGGVLLCGGRDVTTSDTSSRRAMVVRSDGTVTPVGDLVYGRQYAVATLLTNGKVLVSGGFNPSLEGVGATAELYDPATQQFTLLASQMSQNYSRHDAVRLLDGTVLIAGGLIRSERFDPATNTFTRVGDLNYQTTWSQQFRIWPGTVLLPDGRVLIVGGTIGQRDDASAELFRDGGFSSPRTDANFDLRSDVWWRHTTGTNTYWFSQGRGTTSASPLPFGTQWQLATVGDFDGTGSMDAFWRDPVTGANEIWLMSGTQRIAQGGLYPIPDPNWTVAGSGDFSGDGKHDILWRNATTGETVIWLMNGLQAVDGGHLPRIEDTNWQLGAIGDYDGDFKDDLLWRNGVTGENVIWLMNGLTPVNGSHIFGQPDFNFALAASGDFNGDGRADLLWRNDLTGESVIWIVDGLNVVNGSPLPTQPDGNWSFLAAGDYNRNSTTDILWQHNVSGEVVVWFVNGFQVNDAVSWGVAGPGWTAHWK